MGEGGRGWRWICIYIYIAGVSPIAGSDMLTRNALPVYLWLYRNYWIYRLPFRSSWFISTLITLMMRSLGALRPTPLLASSSPSASSSLSLFPSTQVGRSPSSRQFPLYLYPNSAGGQANRKWAFRSRSIVTITDDCRNDDAVFVATREHGVKSGPANEPSNLNPLSSIGSPSLLNHVSICRHFYRTRDVCVCVCLCDCWTKRGRNCKLWVLYGFEMREWRVQLRWLWFLGLGGARCQKNWMGCRENYFRYSMFLVFLFESDYFLRCTFLDGILRNFYYPFYQDGNLLEFSRGFF